MKRKDADDLSVQLRQEVLVGVLALYTAAGLLLLLLDPSTDAFSLKGMPGLIGLAILIVQFVLLRFFICISGLEPKLFIAVVHRTCLHLVPR